MLGGHAWRHIFMACSKLEAMAIYVVKQACGNEIMPSVYDFFLALRQWKSRPSPTISTNHNIVQQSKSAKLSLVEIFAKGQNLGHT